MSHLEMPLDEQMELNIEKRRIDKKVRLMEIEAEERRRAMGKDKSKLNKYKATIRKRAKDLYEKFKP